MASNEDARAAREAKLDELHEKLTDAVESLVSGDDWRQALAFAARFRSRSFNNTMLIWVQHEAAFEAGRVPEPFPTLVAGYRQWQGLGRQVMKGQTGYMIFAPVTGRFASSNPADPNSWRRLGPREKHKVNEVVRSRMVGARPAYVWDASQTDGEPLPVPPAPTLLEGEAPSGLWEGLAGQIRVAGFEVRRGAHLQVAYYDQQREQLDPDRSVFDTLGEGNDTITVNGVSRHVQGYLRDFLFPAERARSPVRALSGGERNRLLLARLFTRPANVLVLDEPTNDLDVETLELLEGLVQEFPGTVLLVSHDRAFLDNVVTSTLAFEGDGRVQEYVGGYDDWVRQRRPPAADAVPGRGVRQAVAPPAPAGGEATSSASRRLSFNEQRELTLLPARIEALEQEHRQLAERTAAPEFYKEGAAAITAALDRLAAVEAELGTAYARWDELDSRSR